MIYNTMQCLTRIPWQPPLNIASYIASKDEEFPCWTLFYSAMKTPYSGSKSFLFLFQEEEIISPNFNELDEKLNAKDKGESLYDNIWSGYLGYELKHELESLPHDAPSFLSFPPLYMAKFGLIAIFDHAQQTIELWAKDSKLVEKGKLLFQAAERMPLPTPLPPSIDYLASNITREDYLSKVSTICNAIIRGEVYQANLTRKFYGQFSKQPSPFDIFLRLCSASPATYSSFIKIKNRTILSSSPERFLQIDNNGKIDARPIKGTIPREQEAELDKNARNQLANSEKDKAENLMIVDLMRNDISRSSKIGSVKVKSLFDITSYSTIHHMSSTICGQKSSDITTLEAIKHCFPPGSMTGAPKIKAMELCSQLEQQQRGVYSGAIGWVSGSGPCDLSVVIRTLLIEDDKFEFQVGGGIVIDSTPIAEWEETIAKARGIALALGITEEEIKKL